MQRERCTANIVTYNTLVDVYGKLGRWQDAIGVIDDVYMQGLEPEVRTFNTVIIAANTCNKPEEALKVRFEITLLSDTLIIRLPIRTHLKEYHCNATCHHDDSHFSLALPRQLDQLAIS